MSGAEDFYPFREDIEAANNFRRIGREIVSLAEGPVEIRIGRTRVFVFNPNRDLNDEVVDRTLAEEDCVVATYESLQQLRSQTNEGRLMPLPNNKNVVLGRERGSLDLEEDDYISRVHALIDRDEQGRLTVHDLGSVNGTFVRNLRINPGDWSVPTYYSQLKDDGPETVEKVRNHQVESSTPSDRHPERNEDAVFTDEENDSIGVFDGVGSTRDAGRASELAAAYIKDALARLPAATTKAFARLMMGEALLDAHQAILEGGGESQTTATVAKFFRDDQDTAYAVIAYSGDSRAYMLREGKLESLTIDHAYMGSESESRRKDLQDTLSDATSLQGLSLEEREAFRRRHVITSALGQEGTPTISFAAVDLRQGDVLILTSDGVHDNLTSTEIQNVAASASFTELADDLVRAARMRSHENHFRSKLDDITAAAVVYNG